uniref:DRBM domain-containing protein n=1 Tax=Clastoptera arizonana TaxID=38151 RepID=A0A1B6EA51_9HEMI
MLGYCSHLRTGSKTPVSILQELLLRCSITPQYELIHNGVGTHEPVFKYKLVAGELMGFGNGKSKKEAKHDAAQNVLKKMQFNKALTESVHVIPTADINFESPYTGAVKENLVGQLSALCYINNIPNPDYRLIREEGPPHARVFTFECLVSTLIETAVARTKKQAKHMVAQQMINRLTQILGDKMVLVPEKQDIDPEDEINGSCQLMLEGEKKNPLNLGLKINEYHNYLFLDPSHYMEVPFEDCIKKLYQRLDECQDLLRLMDELVTLLKCSYKIDVVSTDKMDDNKASDISDNDLLGDFDTLDEPSKISGIKHSSNSEQGEENERKILLIIESSPPQAFINVASSVEMATNNVITEAIQFYHLMIKPEKLNKVEI